MSTIEQVVIFKSDQNEFAFDIMAVQEIIRYKKITKVPKSSDFMVGVVNLRGNVLPVLDFREIIQDKKTELDKTKRIIIVEFEDYKVGILVDSVREVLRVHEDQFQVVQGKNNVSKEMIKLNKGERIISLVSTELIHQLVTDTVAQNAENEQSEENTELSDESGEAPTEINEAS